MSLRTKKPQPESPTASVVDLSDDDIPADLGAGSPPAVETEVVPVAAEPEPRPAPKPKAAKAKKAKSEQVHFVTLLLCNQLTEPATKVILYKNQEVQVPYISSWVEHQAEQIPPQVSYRSVG